MSKSDQGYRQRIYAKYVSQQAGPRGAAHTAEEYQSWATTAEKRIAGWLPNERSAPILDMGCGPGTFLYMLHKLGYTDLAGVDLSSEQVVLARQWCPSAEVIEGDVRSILLDNPNHFALISGLDVIEHFHKDEILPLLELVFSALRPGGRLILQTPNAASPWVGSVAYSDFTHEWFYSPYGLERVLSVVGFTAYQSRECGPDPHGLRSLIRFITWRFIRIGLWAYDLVETGGDNGGIYTRVFLATALKQT